MEETAALSQPVKKRRWTTDKMLRNRIRKTQRQLDETSKLVTELIKTVDRTSKTVDRVTKDLGRHGNALGEFTESMFRQELWKRFNEIGFDVAKQASNYTYTENGKTFAEIDLQIENGDTIILVEIKTKLKIDYVSEHIERIEKIRQYMDKRGDGRKLTGAVAGAVIPENVLSFAHKNGLYVVTLAGDLVVISEAPEGFEPRVWQI